MNHTTYEFWKDLVDAHKYRSEIIKHSGLKPNIVEYYLTKYKFVLEKKTRSIPIPTKEELVQQLYIHHNNSANQLSKHYKVSLGVILKWLEHYNIPYVKKAPGGTGGKSSSIDTSYEFWKDLSERFSTATQIAEHLGTSSWVPGNWLKHHNITLDGRSTSQNKKDIPSKQELENLYRTMSLLEISKHYGNVSNVTVKKWFVHHGIEIRTHRANQKQIMVPKMQQTNMERYGVPGMLPSKHSKGELEVCDWLNSLGYDFKPDRSVLLNNYELDGYDDNIKVAFEYCGLYFHSSKFRDDKRYHWNKYNQCLEKDIRLFTIYENEWQKRNLQCKNFIKGSLGINSKKLQARNCQIKLLGGKSEEVMKFFDDNHIQGAPNGYELCSVLYHDGSIVGAMSFGQHHRQTEQDVLVLSRLCWKDDHMVVGGSQRLFAQIPKVKPIVSWSDNRWSSAGGVYTRLGFEMERDYTPSYDYTNSNGHFKRKQSMMKSIIRATPEQTEEERALELGWYRIYDCGKKKWVFNKS